jgi:EpsI family protein
MTSRRDFLVSALCAASAGSAYALTPRERISLLGSTKLEAIVPKTFAGWRHVESDALVVPQSDDSLASKLYSQSVGRLYMHQDGSGVMLLIAYGDTQSDQLQLHRPEVCYPAFGFALLHNDAGQIAVGGNVKIPGRMITARSQVRTEQISYWTRIGEYLPTSNGEQRNAKLRTAFAGKIPDGVLVRVSSIEDDAEKAFALNARFAAALMSGIAPEHRAALIGTELASDLLRVPRKV